ncbi:MAG: ABC transporter ATP-binding protein [Phycisphaerae bacterium]
MSATKSIIRVNGLCKHYGRLPVLKGVDLTIRRGSLFGFLGPNGAGKTTTIRILLGLLRASAGTALVFGEDCWRAGPHLRRQIGYLPGDVRFHDHLTGAATLAFLAAVRRVNCRAEIRRLSTALDLALDRRVRNYSRGMKQKLGLIQAMMHRPALLILDEPTTALDPLVRETLNDELRRAAGEGRTVLFSSHTLSEVEELCDEVAILRGGRVIEHERVDALRRRAIRHVEITHNRPLPPIPEGMRVLHAGEGHFSGAWSGPIDRLLAWLSMCPAQDVTIAPSRLEDLFLAYYNQSGSVVTPG